MIQIRRSTEGQVPALMAFINAHWLSGHILATSRALMDWQHRDGSEYNYLLAWDGDTLVGTLGYIPTRRYDSALASRNVIWLALWKVSDEYQATGLGLRLLRALEQVEPHEAIAVNGLNHTHPPLYKALGYRTAELTQHFLVNPAEPRYLVQGSSPLPQATSGSARTTELDEHRLRGLDLAPSAIAQKTPRYFIERFLQHPFYRYSVWLLEHDSHRALIATRLAQHDNRCALRIVDFAGDVGVPAHCGGAFLRMMQQQRAEYADFWQHGIDEALLAQAGFGLVNDSVIVPNFYEPYIARNGRILCAYKTTAPQPVIICRADGDQDRPNTLNAS